MQQRGPIGVQPLALPRPTPRALGVWTLAESLLSQHARPRGVSDLLYSQGLLK